MNILIVKIGAVGDVVRTTSLLRAFDGTIDWITGDNCVRWLRTLPGLRECISYENHSQFNGNEYDLVINLEDTFQCCTYIQNVTAKHICGSYVNNQGDVVYSDDSRPWFDLSLISRFGKKKADQLKLKNRQTYQELLFTSLGKKFKGERYILPLPPQTDCFGDIAVAPRAGSVWPMKNWAYFDDLIIKLQKQGLKVNVLPKRATLLEHFGDIKNHKYLISGDSLPMHIAMGYGIRCSAFFLCTSPWEIYPYGLLQKFISPRLDRYFYRRDFDEEATTCFSVQEVFDKVMAHFSEIET